MTLYRVSGMSHLSEALRDKYLTTKTFQKKAIQIENRPAYLIIGKTEEKEVKWTSLLAGLSGQVAQLQSSAAAAVLLIQDTAEDAHDDDEQSDSYLLNDGDPDMSPNIIAWALTFGMGFQLLEQKYIDNGFGQRIAIRAADPKGLNSISKTTLDERPRIERSTIASGGPLRTFGFEDLGDLATRLVTDGHIPGIGRDDNPVKIKGADSLSIPLAKDPKELLLDLENIKATYNLEPASEELAALEQLALVKDKELINVLESALLKAIGEKDNPLLALSFPHELIDEYGDASAHKLIGTRERSARDYLPTLEALLQPINKVPESKRQEKMDRLFVQLFREAEDDTPISPKINVQKWFAFQTEIDGHRYYLHNGKWFSMDRSYAAVVKRRTRDIFDRGPLLEGLPDWSIVDIPNKEQQKIDNAELNYNRILAAHYEGLCLDQKLVRSEMHTRGIEACDVLLTDGTFIHVKHVSSSAPASHLLAQALVSAEVLTHDGEAREHLKSRIRDAGGEPEDYVTKPSKLVIVMAKDDKLLGPDDLFTFTQVNLARQVAHLDQHLTVHIAPVVRRLQTGHTNPLVQ